MNHLYLAGLGLQDGDAGSSAAPVGKSEMAARRRLMLAERTGLKLLNDLNLFLEKRLDELERMR